MIDLWKSLWDMLKIEFETRFDESGDDGADAVVRVTVSNTASPPGTTNPDIVFEDLVLKIGVPPDWHVKELGALSGGQSVTHEHNCSYEDLLDVQCHLDGAVSPEAFFRSWRGGPVHVGIGLTVQAYLEVFNKFQIHRWLESKIRSISAPEPETTLAEIDAQVHSLSEAHAEIRKVSDRFHRWAGLIREQDRTRVQEHRQVVDAYLDRTAKAIGQISASLRSHDPRQISHTVARWVSRLEKQAAEVNAASEKLATKSG